MKIINNTHVLTARGVPKNVECIKDGFGTLEQQVAELWFAMRVEANNLAIEHAAAIFQVASQSFAQATKTVEGVPVARNQPHTVDVRIKQRTKPVPLAHHSRRNARIAATASRPQSERTSTLSIWNARAVTSAPSLAVKSQLAQAKEEDRRAGVHLSRDCQRKRRA